MRNCSSLGFPGYSVRQMGKRGPYQPGHSWIQCLDPTLGPGLRQDNSILGGPGNPSRFQILKDVVTRFPGGPLGFARLPPTSSFASFAYILTFLAPTPEAASRGPRSPAAGSGWAEEVAWACCCFGLQCRLPPGCARVHAVNLQCPLQSRRAVSVHSFVFILFC